MSTKNDVTGAALVTKAATNSYRDGWDRIFGPKVNDKGVPLFDKTKTCSLAPGGNPNDTACTRCHNPHHACDADGVFALSRFPASF